MRGAVFPGDRQVEIKTMSDPHPGPGEVVIAMKASGLCGSDLAGYRAPKPESTEGRPWGQPLKKPAGAPLNLG